MKRLDLFLIILIATFATYSSIYSIDFSKDQITPKHIEEYLRSQDIENYLGPARAHVSDSHIYTASGFLYTLGASPFKYNFEHPPLIKYLFGLSSILLGTAYFAQIGFCILLPILTYILGQNIIKNRLAAFLASFLLIIDPLYLSLAKNLLLDLGQSVFALGYIISSLTLSNSKKRTVLSGLFLGLFAASKFWYPAVIFFVITENFMFYKKKFSPKRIFATLSVAFVVFSLVYLPAYLSGYSYNIVFLQAKIAKFMLEHDVSTQVGSLFTLFLNGKLSPWWQGGSSLIQTEWTIFWPVAFVGSILNIIYERRINKKTFLGILPIVYLISLLGGAPFTRYFILALPFLYLSTFDLATKLWEPIFRKTKKAQKLAISG